VTPLFAAAIAALQVPGCRAVFGIAVIGRAIGLLSAIPPIGAAVGAGPAVLMRRRAQPIVKLRLASRPDPIAAVTAQAVSRCGDHDAGVALLLASSPTSRSNAPSP